MSHEEHFYKEHRANASSRKVRATNLALAATTLLTLSKVVVALVSGSVGVLSEAIHSSLDLFSSVITFFVVREASRPADIHHQFGHGKIESLSAMLEAFLLLVAAAFIGYEGFEKWTHPTEVTHLGWGLLVIGVSVLVNLGVYLQNRHVAREEESIAIETNAFHFLTDVFSSLAVFLGLGLVHLTGKMLFDPLVAFVIALYTAWVGIEQIRKCVHDLSDSSLPPDEVDAIVKEISRHEALFLSFHDVRTRRVGHVRHVEFHLNVCSERSVADAHEVCDVIEQGIRQLFKDAHANIHLEPCEAFHPQCLGGCALPQKAVKKIGGGSHGK